MDDAVRGLADLCYRAGCGARVGGDDGDPDRPGARVDREAAGLMMGVGMQRDRAHDAVLSLADGKHLGCVQRAEGGDPHKSPPRVHSDAGRVLEAADAVRHPVRGLADSDDRARSEAGRGPTVRVFGSAATSRTPGRIVMLAVTRLVTSLIRTRRPAATHTLRVWWSMVTWSGIPPTLMRCRLMALVPAVAAAGTVSTAPTVRARPAAAATVFGTRCVNVPPRLRSRTETLREGARLTTEVLTVRLDQVGKRYAIGQPWVLRDVSLEIRPGTLVRFDGRNGSGKSTLLRLIAGITTPTKGTVRGRPVTGYVPERFPPALPFTGRDYLTHLG